MEHRDLLRLAEKVSDARYELRGAILKADVPCPADDMHYAMQAKDADELIGVRFKQLDSALSALLHDIDAVMPYPVKLNAPDNEPSERGYDVTCIDFNGEELMCQFFDNYYKADDFAEEQLRDGYCEAVRIEAVEKRLKAVWRLSTNEL